MLTPPGRKEGWSNTALSSEPASPPLHGFFRDHHQQDGLVSGVTAAAGGDAKMAVRPSAVSVAAC